MRLPVPCPPEAAFNVCLPVKTQTQLSRGPGAPFITPPPSPDRTCGNSQNCKPGAGMGILLPEMFIIFFSGFEGFFHIQISYLEY